MDTILNVPIDNKGGNKMIREQMYKRKCRNCREFFLKGKGYVLCKKCRASTKEGTHIRIYKDTRERLSRYLNNNVSGKKLKSKDDIINYLIDEEQKY